MTETFSNTKNESTSSAGKSKWIYLVLVVLLISAGALYYGLSTGKLYKEPGPRDPGTVEEVAIREVLASTRSAEYEEALQKHEAIVASNSYTPDQKAYSAWSVADARYKTSYDIADAVRGVQEMKAIAVNPEVSVELRAQALATVASSYSQHGENVEIYKAVFGEPPYDRYVVEGNPPATTRALMEVAHNQVPLFKTATSIASLYIRDVLMNESDLDTQERFRLMEKARSFMKEGEVLISENLASSERLPESRRYIGHYFWRAFTLGGLAVLDDAQGLYEYKDAYSDLFERIENSPNTEARQYLPFAHWMYATFLLVVEDDEAVARTHLNAAIAFVENDPERSVNEFQTYLRNRKGDVDLAENEFLARNLNRLQEVSPEFAAFYESLEPMSQ